MRRRKCASLRAGVKRISSLSATKSLPARTYPSNACNPWPKAVEIAAQ
jgi:hypothetical protein